MGYEQARCECYKLLAACFCRPERDALIEEKTLQSLSGLLSRVCPDAEPCGVHMSDALLKYSNEELLVEYARLFVGPYELKAAPYGSVYLETGGKIMGDSTIAAATVYKEEGLSLDENFNEIPDHIAAELEFMYYLAFKEVEALEKNDAEKAAYFLNRQEYFLRTFLGAWVAPFRGKIKQGTENEFYQALADCLEVFISKTNYNDVMPEELKVSLART